MIKSIKQNGKNVSLSSAYVRLDDCKIEINPECFNTNSTTLEFEFSVAIKSFRNHDYQWSALIQRLISNWYSPKILKMENGFYIQANQHSGIWEVDTTNPYKLLWHFNLENSNPLASYDMHNSRRIVQANVLKPFKAPIGLLFSKKGAVECSRSKIPFSAIACFTDHCDFDTLSSLVLQREFFLKCGIKVTKGFFLYHYSKRDDTASVENHRDELRKWLDEGHELAYHSLSQSIKPLEDAMEDFKTFVPPFETIKTWIDHGFQPYNLTQYVNYGKINKDYGNTISEKKISNFWNYIDSGSSIEGVINQINPQQFTLETFYKGVGQMDRKTGIQQMLKNITFYYFNSQNSLRVYGGISKYLKSIKQKKSIKKHIKMVADTVKLAIMLFPILVFWKRSKKKVYPLAAYAPVCFDYEIFEKTFTVFQTIEMNDFKLGLSKSNIDLLIKESGLFIAHTYFSAPMDYHKGKLFTKTDEIDSKVEENFMYLSEKIKSLEVWNPTLEELLCQMKQLEHVCFDCTSSGDIFVEDAHNLPNREVR